MKLGLLTQWYDPEPGPAAVPGVLANGLADRGHDVRVLTGFPNYPTGRIYSEYRQRWVHVEEPRDTFEVRRVPLVPSHDANPLTRAANYTSFAASAALQAPDYLADRDALWVYNSPATVGLVARRLARRHSLPFLLHVMDVWPDSVLQSGMLSRKSAQRAAEMVLGNIVRRTHESAALVAVTSPGQQDLLHARGVPWAKLRYAPLWADESIYFPREPDRSLLPQAAQNASLVVMYAGAIGHVQGLDDAIRAVAIAPSDIHLVLVGSGVAEKGLRLLATEIDARNVHFMGARPPSAMGDLASAADIHLVSLSDTPLMRVTMPSKLQAIMALGKPILATCAGDAAKAVRAADAGLTLEPGQVGELAMSLEALAGDSGTLTRWGLSGRRYYLREFALAKTISLVEDLLMEIA